MLSEVGGGDEEIPFTFMHHRLWTDLESDRGDLCHQCRDLVTWCSRERSKAKQASDYLIGLRPRLLNPRSILSQHPLKNDAGY